MSDPSYRPPVVGPGQVHHLRPTAKDGRCHLPGCYGWPGWICDDRQFPPCQLHLCEKHRTVVDGQDLCPVHAAAAHERLNELHLRDVWIRRAAIGCYILAGVILVAGAAWKLL